MLALLASSTAANAEVCFVRDEAPKFTLDGVEVNEHVSLSESVGSDPILCNGQVFWTRKQQLDSPLVGFSKDFGGAEPMQHSSTEYALGRPL